MWEWVGKPLLLDIDIIAKAHLSGIFFYWDLQERHCMSRRSLPRNEALCCSAVTVGDCHDTDYQDDYSITYTHNLYLYI